LSVAFAAVVDADDVFVVEAGGQLGLAIETLAKLEVGRSPRWAGL
jgi:hypothetical protein